MKFTATIVAIFASAAFAASPAMPAGAADAMPSGAAGAIPSGAPEVSPDLKKCAEKCASKTDPTEAIACLKKECADAVKSIGGDMGMGGGPASGAAPSGAAPSGAAPSGAAAGAADAM